MAGKKVSGERNLPTPIRTGLIRAGSGADCTPGTPPLLQSEGWSGLPWAYALHVRGQEERKHAQCKGKGSSQGHRELCKLKYQPRSNVSLAASALR